MLTIWSSQILVIGFAAVPRDQHQSLFEHDVFENVYPTNSWNDVVLRENMNWHDSISNGKSSYAQTGFLSCGTTANSFSKVSVNDGEPRCETQAHEYQIGDTKCKYTVKMIMIYMSYILYLVSSIFPLATGEHFWSNSLGT